MTEDRTDPEVENPETPETPGNVEEAPPPLEFEARPAEPETPAPVPVRQEPEETETTAPAQQEAEEEEEEEVNYFGRVMVGGTIFLIALIIFGSIFLFKSCGKPAVTATENIVTVVTNTVTVTNFVEEAEGVSTPKVAEVSEAAPAPTKEKEEVKESPNSAAMAEVLERLKKLEEEKEGLKKELELSKKSVKPSIEHPGARPELESSDEADMAKPFLARLKTGQTVLLAAVNIRGKRLPMTVLQSPVNERRPGYRDAKEWELKEPSEIESFQVHEGLIVPIEPRKVQPGRKFWVKVPQGS